jgi:hypothetical protein
MAPGIQGAGCVRLPGVGLGVGELAALDVRQGGAEHEGIVLVGDDRLVAPLGRQVIVIGGELFDVGPEGLVDDPPVEVEDLGVKAVDDLRRADQPVV